MAPNNQILQTTLDDINNIEQLAVGSSLRRLRTAIDMVDRRLIIYNRRLVELYNNEKILKARIYNNADMLSIDRKYLAGLNTKVDPTQSFEKEGSSPDPHENISYNKFNLISLSEGMKELDSELNRINNEINVIQIQVNAYEKTKIKLSSQLAEVETQKNKQNFINKVVGKIMPPTPADLEADKISQARAANILLLQRLCMTYYEYTLTGMYPDEKKLPKDLLIIRQVFWATAQSPGLTFTEKDKLDYNNPGAPQNQTILYNALSLERYASKNTKTTLNVDRYVKDLLMVSNDASISKGINRKSNESISVNNSLRDRTKSYPVSALRLGDFYLGSFEIPSFTDSINKWWKKKNSKLYYNLPLCPKIPSPSPTNTDSKENKAEDEAFAIKAAGTSVYLSKLEEAKNFQSQEQAKLYGDLPSTAPEWVYSYISIFNEGPKGALSLNSQNVVVFRGVGKTVEDAKKNSLSITGTFGISNDFFINDNDKEFIWNAIGYGTPKEIDSYSYLSGSTYIAWVMIGV